MHIDYCYKVKDPQCFEDQEETNYNIRVRQFIYLGAYKENHEERRENQKIHIETKEENEIRAENISVKIKDKIKYH